MIRKRGTVEFKGQLITTAELARLHDLPVSTIAHRYWRGDRDDLLVRPTKTAKTKASCPTCGVEFVKINDQRRVFCSAACMKNRGGRGISRPVTHGETYTRLYRIWHSMKKRCNPNLTNPNPNYAGKGIRVCEEWLQYEPFRDWALSHGYSDDLEIDRINPALGYAPDNCRWATCSQQAWNMKKAKGKSSQFKGVSFDKPSGKWRACGILNGVHTWLGKFAEEKDAAEAYDDWARCAFGEFACLNFPREGSNERSAI